MTMYNPPHQPRNGIAVVEGSGALPGELAGYAVQL